MSSTGILQYTDAQNSTLHDHTHKGTGQAGNKSLLSYRHDIGIPGYTGFISNAHSVAVPIKGNTQYIGKKADAYTLDKSLSSLVDCDSQSVYSQEFVKPAAKPAASDDGAPTTERGGGYWIAKANNGEDMSKKKFLAKSTYKAEVQESAKTAEAAFGQTCMMPGLRFTRKTDISNDDSGKAEFAYQTEYSQMRMRKPLTGTKRSAVPRVGMKSSDVHKDEPILLNSTIQEEQVGASVQPRFDGHTIYSQTYGKYGSKPESAQPENAREFEMGTTKGTSKIPGYSGFIPSTENNMKAVDQATGLECRPSAKNEMLLFSLDQYSRESIPQYKGFRPQDGRNIKPSRGPTTETTQGQANHEGTQLGAGYLNQQDNREVFRNSDKGIMSFFSQGSTYVSENGRAYAERYYHTLRPKEGLPRIYYPSKTTLSGYQFSE